MELTKDDIIDFALRYLSADEMADFPCPGDLFYFLIRTLSQNRNNIKDDEGWMFGGYGLCTGFSCDENEKPRGKWINMHFASLISFPPENQTLRLQPPHIVKGLFQSADRTYEIRIVKIDRESPSSSEKCPTPPKPPQSLKTTRRGSPSREPANVVAFRPKKKPEGGKKM